MASIGAELACRREAVRVGGGEKRIARDFVDVPPLSNREAVPERPTADACPEDCGYCSQSVTAESDVKATKLMDVRAVLGAGIDYYNHRWSRATPRCPSASHPSPPASACRRAAPPMSRVLPARVAPYAQHLIEKVPPDLSRFLLAPIPGLLMRLDVGEGDGVEAGQPLAVVEAMKMENILRAGKSGTVKTVSADAGESLTVDQVILELE